MNIWVRTWRFDPKRAASRLQHHEWSSLSVLMMTCVVSPWRVLVTEDICALLSYLTYYPDEMSAQLWSLFGPLVVALDNYAYDFIMDMLPALFNFISKEPHNFLAYMIGDQPAVQKLLEVSTQSHTTHLASAGTASFSSFCLLLLGSTQIAKKTIENDTHMEQDARAALKLIGIIVQSCPGGIDHCIPGIVQLMMEKSAGIQADLTLLKVLNVVMSLLHYNAQVNLLASSRCLWVMG